MFSNSQLDQIKKRFNDRFDNLERDAYRAFTSKIELDHSLGLGVAPFPITLFCMSMLDYFSGLYFGYSEIKRKKVRKNQTKRMSEFLAKYLNYDSNVSEKILKVFRHILVHTAEPSITEKLYKSGIKGWILSELADEGDHWTIKSYASKNMVIHFAAGNFIRDLKTGVLGELGYFNDLVRMQSLQDNYINFYKELNSS